MPQAFSQSPNDPFSGLLLPMNAWKALDDAHITSLEQLKSMAPLIGQIPSFDPEVVQIIQDRLARRTTRRTVRVRLVFPKRPHRKTGHRRNSRRGQGAMRAVGQRSEMTLNEQQVTSTVPSA